MAQMYEPSITLRGLVRFQFKNNLGTTGYMSNRIESRHLNRYLYTYIPSIHNSQKAEAAKCPRGGKSWTQCGVYTDAPYGVDEP